jgi:hypothetical protein
MNILILLISILTVYISVKLFSQACGSMSILKLNTVSYVFYFQIVTSSIVASVLMAMGMLDYHGDLALVSYEVKIEAWIWTMYSLLLMPASMILLNYVMRINAKERFAQFLNEDINIQGSEIRNKLAIICFTLFSAAVLSYVLYYTGKVPLFTLLIDGDVEGANIGRITSRRDFQGINHIKNLLGLIMIPVITYYSYFMMRTKKKMFYFIFFLINFGLALVMVAHDIQKAPIAFFVIGLAIAEVFYSKGISLKTFVLLVVLPVGLILIGYSLTTDKGFSDQLLNVNSGFYGRTFLIGYFGFPLSLELFPDVITIPTYAVGIPKALLDNIDVNSLESARLLKMYVHPETIISGKGNLYSGFYMGEAWANYGYLGLLIAPAIVGFVLQAVHLFLLTHKKNPLLLAFYIGLTVKWVVASGFVNFLYLKLLIWPLVLYLITNYILKKILKVK